MAYATYDYKALLTSNPLEKVHASLQDMRRATHTRNVLNTEKPNSLSNIFSHVDLFSA